jgi:hypothetical protein
LTQLKHRLQALVGPPAAGFPATPPPGLLGRLPS